MTRIVLSLSAGLIIFTAGMSSNEIGLWAIIPYAMGYTVFTIARDYERKNIKNE